MFSRIRQVKKNARELRETDHKLISFLHQVKGTFKNQRKKSLILFGVLLVTAIYLAGIMGEFPLLVSGEINAISCDPISVIYCYFTGMPVTFLLSLVIICLGTYGLMYVKNLLSMKPERDEESRVNDADDGSYGNAHWMDDEEKAKALVMAKDVKSLSLDILGVDENGYKCCRKEVMYSNGNVISIGAPGSGKTTAYLLNDIYQSIRRGDSFLAIDSKGGVYKDSAYAAIKAGYNVKIFNTKPDEVKYSDALNPLLQIDTADTEDAKAKATTITNVIMSNIGEGESGKKDIWFTSSYNLLRSMILAIKFAEDLPESEKHLPKVYDTLVENSDLRDLEAKFEYITYNRSHPAYASYKTFLGEPEAVRVSALGGLITNLNFLDNEYVKAILSHDEIDLEKPGKEKCAYYIVISDTDKSNNVLAPLFIETLCIRLTALADKQKNLKLPVTTNLYIDEMKNVGKLPGIAEKLSTYRSRGINIKCYIQDLSQLTQMFPNEGWREIIADCTTMVVLKVGEQNTAEYIERMMGTKTISIKNTTYEEFVGDPLKLHPDYRLQQGTGSRPLMYAAEIRGEGKYGLQSDEVLVLIDGEAPLKLKKFQYWHHPFYHALHMDRDDRKLRTIDHMPAWRGAFDAERERLRSKEEFRRVNLKEYGPEDEGNEGMKRVVMSKVMENTVSQKAAAHSSGKGNGSYGKRKGI